MTDVGPVPIHPEAVPGAPETLRWVIPAGTLAVRGEVRSAPGEFGDLLRAGVCAASVTADAVLVRVTPPATWRDQGARIRTALGWALREAAGWQASADPVVGRDARLAEATLRLLSGETGDYLRSHGGHIELIGVDRGCVEVRLTGACGHCPAAGATLHQRVERSLRSACPDLVELRQVS